MNIQGLGDSFSTITSLNTVSAAKDRNASADQTGTDRNMVADTNKTAENAATQVDPTGKTANARQEETQQAADAMQEFVSQINSSLQFSVDKDLGRTVVKVVDTSNGDVIKQIPSEEAIALAKALDKIKGLLVQQKA